MHDERCGGQTPCPVRAHTHNRESRVVFASAVVALSVRRDAADEIAAPITLQQHESRRALSDNCARTAVCKSGLAYSFS